MRNQQLSTYPAEATRKRIDRLAAAEKRTAGQMAVILIEEALEAREAPSKRQEPANG